MNARSVRSLLKRADRYTRQKNAEAAAARDDGRRLDPAMVDAVLEDDSVELFAEAAEEAPATSAASEAECLLTALRVQLAELESHQSTIRSLLDQVELETTTALN